MNDMSKRKAVFWLVLSVMLTMALMTGPDLWAGPGQSPARQTVLTRTPSPTPTEPPTPPISPLATTQPVPAPTALAVSSTVSDAAHAEASSEPILPEAGGRSTRPYLGVAMITIGLLALAAVGRRA